MKYNFLPFLFQVTADAKTNIEIAQSVSEILSTICEEDNCEVDSWKVEQLEEEDLFVLFVLCKQKD